MKWSWFFIIGGASLLGVIGYNYWAYCCGRCSMQNFLSLGPFGMILMSCVFFMAAILFVLKIRGQRNDLRCRCGVLQEKNWIFCPACGIQRR